MSESEIKVVEYFLENPHASMIQISAATGISKSSVQRYLNKPAIADIVIPELNCMIKEQIQNNLRKGRQKGGRNTFSAYDSIKDEQGRFMGLKETQINNKEEIKQEDIKKIVNFFSHFSHYTLDQLALELGSIYTSDYIYKCLTDPRVEEIFGRVIASAISKQLSDNKYSVLRKYDNCFGEELFEQANLSIEEINILKMRFNGENIRSAESVAIELGVSKTTVNNIEDKALAKIKQYQESQKKY